MEKPLQGHSGVQAIAHQCDGAVWFSPATTRLEILWRRGTQARRMSWIYLLRSLTLTLHSSGPAEGASHCPFLSPLPSNLPATSSLKTPHLKSPLWLYFSCQCWSGEEGARKAAPARLMESAPGCWSCVSQLCGLLWCQFPCWKRGCPASLRTFNWS